ncbi:unnamed protein product [Macrosiphum euphorbiae]|uniref:Uncharacterized protein n=1 Tax=Macrosiphum euphorbiae TaxID=13131 RepID=A0AAV0Y2L0_9HEMI|nr:unnamed protein product [Macrosiphum euphorbiae]
MLKRRKYVENRRFDKKSATRRPTSKKNPIGSGNKTRRHFLKPVIFFDAHAHDVDSASTSKTRAGHRSPSATSVSPPRTLSTVPTRSVRSDVETPKTRRKLAFRRKVERLRCSDKKSATRRPTSKKNPIGSGKKNEKTFSETRDFF